MRFEISLLITIICIASILEFSPIVHSEMTEMTTLQLMPKDNYLQPMDNFTLVVYVTNVTNLNRWQITLKFDPSCMECINVSLPADNIFAGNEIIDPAPYINNTNGLVVKFAALDSSLGVNGSGKLVQIDFKAHSFTCQTYISFEGINQINPFNGTYLQDPQGHLIIFQHSSSTIHILPQPNIFTVSSNGEHYNITVYTNATSISAFNYNKTARQISFNLTAPQSTLSFTCVKIPKAVLNNSYYVVKANDEVIPTEIFQNQTQVLICFLYTHKITEIKITIIGTIIGDLDGDGKVDIRDVAFVATRFGTQEGDPNWDPKADLTGPENTPDGKVDIRDIALVASHYGEYV